MGSAVTTITERVRERIRADGADLRGGAGIAERYVLDEIQRYSERALGGSLPLLPDERDAARQVLAALTGYGPLQPYFDDDTVEEIWINSPDRVFVARDGVSQLTGVRLTEGQVRELVERMLQSTGRRVDSLSLISDVSLTGLFPLCGVPSEDGVGLEFRSLRK